MIILDFDRTLFNTLLFDTVHQLDKTKSVPIKDLSEFLFDDVIPFLEKHSSKTLTICSACLYGATPEYQKSLIKASGISGYMDDIVVTDKPKEEEIGILLDKYKENAFFIDDKPDVLKPVHDNFSNVVSVRINREGDKYSDLETPGGILEVTNLEEFSKLIEGKEA